MGFDLCVFRHFTLVCGSLASSSKVNEALDTAFTTFVCSSSLSYLSHARICESSFDEVEVFVCSKESHTQVALHDIKPLILPECISILIHMSYFSDACPILLVHVTLVLFPFIPSSHFGSECPYFFKHMPISGSPVRAGCALGRNLCSSFSIWELTSLFTVTSLTRLVVP